MNKQKLVHKGLSAIWSLESSAVKLLEQHANTSHEKEAIELASRNTVP